MGEQKGDLPFYEGDIILLLGDAGSGWLEGKTEAGVRLASKC